MPLSLIPYVVAIVIAFGAVAAAGFKGYSLGRDSRAEEVSELRMAIDASRAAAAAAEERAIGISERVRTVYKDRVKVIREEAPAQIQLVERVIVEADPNCSLPASYRSLWNGDPPAIRAADQGSPGTPVAVAELAEATASAKQAFEENRAKLDALQSLVKEHSGNHN